MASNIDIQKKCELCGKLFIAHKTSTRCCSHRCANLAYKERTRQKRVSEFQTMVNQQIEKEDCIDKDFFTPSEAAKYIGISRATFYRYLETNLIKSVQLKRKTIIRKRDIEALFDNASPYKKHQPRSKRIHHPNSYLSRNSAAGYYSTFRALLKIAYKEKMLRENLNDFLEKIEWKKVKKEYLTLDEVKQLAATPCRIPVLKQASLFACMTGLRISDILKLQWSDFEMGPDQGYYIRICTEKTETEATLPISHEALELCGEWGKGLVFKGLTRAMTHHPLKQWIAEAGIKKKITFHCASHSISSFSLNTNDLQN